MGHVRDLPKSRLGIDVEHDFEPKYITIRGKGELLASLRKAAKKADKVYLATDPDREGEAISWHLSIALNLDENKMRRITFNEITKSAVKASIKQARDIDMNLVDEQQARRCLDRMVGYEISPLLWKKIKRGLSAGRVQSVAVRLIRDREIEIENFKPDELRALTDLAHRHGMYVHMDGARLANACAALNLGFRELTVDCGIDILSFGGTKNGLMLGESVVVFNPALKKEAYFVRKQSAQLASKLRYLSCQFTAYLTDSLWLKNAAHANRMAKILYDGLKELPGAHFTQKVESNQLFLTMPRPVIDELLKDYFFYFWDEAIHEIRFVTSFDTTEEDIEQLLQSVKRLL